MRLPFRWLFAAAALLAVGLLTIPGAHAYKEWRRTQRLRGLLAAPPNTLEGFEVEPDPDGPLVGDEFGERDDAMLRRLARRSLVGDPTPEVKAQWRRIAREETLRWPHLFPGKTRSRVPGEAWVSLGPTDAAFQWNGTQYLKVDSGRLSGIAVDPRDANVVYVATSGGGVWKTWDFVSSAPNPTWHPITETLGDLAIGALAMDPNAPDTLYLGLGDPYDTGGSVVVKSTDGGATWSAGATLAGTYPAGSGGLAVTAQSLRDVEVDPANSNIVLAATDVGLFRSVDGGLTFSLVDLPNAGGTQLAESAWTITFGGAIGPSSQWIVTGVTACAQGWLPPWAGYGVTAGGSSSMKNPAAPCTLGNLGDMWRSTDAGVNWTSLRGTGGAWPAIPAGDLGRIAVAAGAPNAGSTVMYAMLGSEDETGGAGTKTQGIWRTTNGGVTWQDASGTLANRTNNVGGNRDCGDMNVGHAQTWYNQAVAVDPTNAANVIIGGDLCGLRTLSGLNGTPSWENVSHWLPSSGRAQVTGGTLPYVHADWHAALVSNVGGTVRVFAGTDGGIFVSTNVFSGAVAPPGVVWDFDNRGIVTHLSYSVGSGDPADGNPFVAFTGLQDNGTRFRDSTATPTTFNQVIGGDGIGAAVNKGTTGEWYWGSVEYGHLYCRPTSGNAYCNQGGAWIQQNPTVGGSDAQPFFVRYSPIQTDPSGAAFLTTTDHAVWRSNSTPTWTRLGPTYGLFVRNVFASQNVANLYGAALSGGFFAVTNNAVTWTTAATQLGVGAAANQRMRYTTMLAFPPTTPGGKTPGDVYLASSAAPVMDDMSPVPATIGHLFLTQDRGTTWAPFHGNGLGQDLPNVPIQVVRYDPGDPSNSTIYAGTDLGLYRSTDGGQSWARFGYGLPLVAVYDIYIAKNQSLLRIGTYGRGLWEIYPGASTAKGVNGDGDFDRNQMLDFRDLAAMASRLGMTPATTGWPGYSWIEDMTGAGSSPPTNGIDDNDLSALLGNFGNHP